MPTIAKREAELREHESRLHEITSTLAGITAGAEILPSLPAAQRAGLESMMLTELRRLQRVLAGDGNHEICSLDLDTIIAPLVATHRARGRTVAWQPSGLHALGGADALSEALNVLLDNAAVHGAPDDIRVAVAAREHRIQITVTDTGPGVDHGTRERLFAWGTRRRESSGRGIGLHAARTHLRDGGGDLRLVSGAPTRFVVELPATALRPTTDRTVPTR